MTMRYFSAGSPSESPSRDEPGPRASRTRVTKSPAATSEPPRSEAVTLETPLPPEDPLVLDEIDRIIEELQTRRGDGEPHGEPGSGVAPYARGRFGAAADGGDRLGTVSSGYLDEHFEATRRALGHINETVGELEKTAASLRQRVSVADSELDRVTREYLFLRNQGRMSGPGEVVGSVAPPWSEGEPDDAPTFGFGAGPPLTSGSFTAIRAASATGVPSVYEQFTVDRYNRTMDSLKAGRTKLVLWTLALSAVIGVALVALMLYSPVVSPPIWIAALPLVWIIPIPYFLLAFRGTQRMLQRNHLNLPEAT